MSGDDNRVTRVSGNLPNRVAVRKLMSDTHTDVKRENGKDEHLLGGEKANMLIPVSLRV